MTKDTTRTRTRVLSSFNRYDTLYQCPFHLEGFAIVPFGDTHGLQQYYPGDNFREYQTDLMVDSVKRFGSVKPCHHWQENTRFYIPDPSATYPFIWASGDTDLDSYYAVDSCYSMMQPGLANARTLYYDTLYKRFKKQFADPRLPTSILLNRDPFDTDFSIWYVLVDLIDLPRMVKSLIPIMRHSRKRILRMSTRDKALTLKQISDLHLGYIFGVLPTQADLVGAVELITRFTRLVFALRELNKKQFRWHQTTDLLKLLDIPDRVNHEQAYGIFPPFYGGSVLVDMFEKIDRMDFHRTLWYKVICPELLTWLDKLKAFSDLSGVLDPAAVWDVIPFSFVVDWFLPVGEWVHRHRPRFEHCNLQVVDYCESIDYRATLVHTARNVLSSQDGVSATYPPTRRDIDIAVTRVKVYHRERFKPPQMPRLGKVLRNASGLNMFRFLTGASLLNQRIPRNARPD